MCSFRLKAFMHSRDDLVSHLDLVSAGKRAKHQANTHKCCLLYYSCGCFHPILSFIFFDDIFVRNFPNAMTLFLSVLWDKNKLWSDRGAWTLGSVIKINELIEDKAMTNDLLLGNVKKSLQPQLNSRPMLVEKSCLAFAASEILHIHFDTLTNLVPLKRKIAHMRGSAHVRKKSFSSRILKSFIFMTIRERLEAA